MPADKASAAAVEFPPSCVLIYAPFGKDSEVIERVLMRAGIQARRCPTLSELFDGIGAMPGSIIIADEALNKQVVDQFASLLRSQPQWSDLPVVVMTSGGDADDASVYRLRLLEPLGNLTLLERPLRKVTLVSAINTALRARARQYEIRDYVDQKKRTEEELRNSEQRWRFLANTMPQFIWVTRGDGSVDFINEYWYDYTGLPSGDAASWEQVVHPDDKSVLREILPPNHGTKRELSFEYRVRRVTDGVWRWHAGLLKAEQSSAEHVSRWIGVGIDIHDRRETEAALRRANAALEQFAYAAAHDLQEPVRTIAVYAQLVARSCEGKLDKKADQYLKFTIEGAQRMQGLIHDLFTYTRAVEDQPAPEAECDADKVVGIVLQNLQTALEDAKAEVTSGPLPRLAVSETHLTQLLQNLVSNAVKYRSERTPRIEISATPVGDQYLFSVKDNGQGIAPQHFQRIFQVFKRLHGREVPGTGIGLAICERVVTHYGGKIWLESEVGKGTTFFFSLPGWEAVRKQAS